MQLIVLGKSHIIKGVIFYSLAVNNRITLDGKNLTGGYFNNFFR